MEIGKLCDDARYSGVLERLIKELDGQEVLYLNFESDYQGFVDIDVLLKDNRVFSYMYWYGSCSGCDEWEAYDFTNEQIKTIMQNEATYWDTKEQYSQWAKTNRKNKEED